MDQRTYAHTHTHTHTQQKTKSIGREKDIDDKPFKKRNAKPTQNADERGLRRTLSDQPSTRTTSRVVAPGEYEREDHRSRRNRAIEH